MSLYASYISEREIGNVLETDRGFATYFINGQECYIRDIYVLPDFRQTNEAAKMADKISTIAKERGCSHLLGTVVPQANNSTTSIKVLLSYGFKLLRSETSMIYFIKEL